MAPVQAGSSHFIGTRGGLWSQKMIVPEGGADTEAVDVYFPPYANLINLLFHIKCVT